MPHFISNGNMNKGEKTTRQSLFFCVPVRNLLPQTVVVIVSYIDITAVIYHREINRINNRIQGCVSICRNLKSEMPATLGQSRDPFKVEDIRRKDMVQCYILSARLERQCEQREDHIHAAPPLWPVFNIPENRRDYSRRTTLRNKQTNNADPQAVNLPRIRRNKLLNRFDSSYGTAFKSL